ncbi:glycosyltransferase family 4 protein [Nafulsella turpanensis]|uniref:glycosyltransferase family 4 protein n=1 Tax=Nafulsella turpanensis TaxID=1265690 RepID=UPI00036283C5|nr:glycosyltransferase family 4 protein [Nafulsella turpanensis]
MKKVAIVINTSWNIFNFRLRLIKALQAQGMEVFAIAPPDEYSARLEVAGCRFIPVKMQGSGSNPFHELRVIRKLYEAYKEIQPDVVLHYTIKPNVYGTLAARALGIPCINNVSGLGTVFLNNSTVAKIARRLYGFAFRFPQKVFFQNKDDQRLFLRFKLVKPEITEVIPGSGIDTTRFSPNGRIKNTSFTFLVLSRLLYDKGIAEYVEAAGILKRKGIKARFQLMGAPDPGHRRGISLAVIDSWKEKGCVEYLGTTDDVLPYIRHADCVVLPSYREGTPRSLLEAASAGKPIVTTDVPGCNNIVQDEVNGYLCKAKDALDLADKMERMYQLDSHHREELGRKSRQIAVEKFDEKIVIDRYLQAIEEITR